MNKLPELLCPAGSPEALDAAIEGGADAIYLGGAAFNARMNAKNFSGDALADAVKRAHLYGVKVYMTLNTLVTDRELSAFVDAARQAARVGVDALIVADMGGAAAIHRAIPSLELHASTQMSGHHSNMGAELKSLGFSRMVIARETSAKNLAEIVRNSPIEVEYFIHGALCVSHSGQCLFSSVVGGRSGNRGECAQPCRLPYGCAGCKKQKESYPLSLKDLSLAQHVPFLIDSGVSSLKIEGRMKSPEYVRDVARIWRRLLDERRGATREEMQELSRIFSRQGFTDGYFTEKIDSSMLGVRSAEDKQVSREAELFRGLTKKLPLSVSVTVKEDTPMKLKLNCGANEATVQGNIPEKAINAPMSEQSVLKNLTKLGGTPFAVENASVSLGEGLMVPVSALNELRRRGVSALTEQLTSLREHQECSDTRLLPVQKRRTCRSARFYTEEQLTDAALAYFDRTYLPLQCYTPKANGVVMPPVVFDSETPQVLSMLKKAKEQGAIYALVGNIGHLKMVRDCGLIPVGDYRFNLTNGESVRGCEDMGIDESILSPELTLPQMRDIGGNTAAIVYGRLPLMTLEKCVIRQIADCKQCATNRVRITDRKGISFPVLREWTHRNVIYNSLPTCMSDRQEELRRYSINAWHFLFSDEAPKEVDAVISAYRKGIALNTSVRRIQGAK